MYRSARSFCPPSLCFSLFVPLVGAARNLIRALFLFNMRTAFLLLVLAPLDTSAECSGWCSAGSCTDARCKTCEVCGAAAAHKHPPPPPKWCPGWCKVSTCGQEACEGCKVCANISPCPTWCNAPMCQHVTECAENCIESGEACDPDAVAEEASSSLCPDWCSVEEADNTCRHVPACQPCAFCTEIMEEIAAEAAGTSYGGDAGNYDAYDASAPGDAAASVGVPGCAAWCKKEGEVDTCAESDCLSCEACTGGASSYGAEGAAVASRCPAWCTHEICHVEECDRNCMEEGEACGPGNAASQCPAWVREASAEG